MKNFFFICSIILGSFGIGLTATNADTLTTLSYEVRGARLQVSPSAVSVPKGIAASIRTDVNLPGLETGTYVEATLRGPSFPARRVLGLPNQPLLLPPLNLVGDYRLDNIRLVDVATGQTRLEGAPSSVPIRVFEEVLVSRVTSRQLTLDEIQEKGIVIDQNNFRALEFEVAFVLDGGTFNVQFPVVSPVFNQVTEIIPAAEIEARNVQAALINQQLRETVKLPEELTGSLLNWEIQPINFQTVVDEGDRDLGLRIPPIPALLVIPGNIGFLNQFFSVQLYTANASPSGSGLVVNELTAELKLPLGSDQVAGTYSAPGDDPLRFARVGANAVIQNKLPVRNPGPDGQRGTADDIIRLQPGMEGQAEFLVEGLREGLHIVDVVLTGKLEGLAAGAVNITGKAAGAVLVRNPQFSLAFSHPRTVRAGEPYEASVTVLNIGGATANLLSTTLAAASISGAILTSDPTVELGNLAPGESATATYQFTAQRTGSITFSQLTSDDAIIGRFRLRAGVDERGVALSPDTIIMPDLVDLLPLSVRQAANRILGQALSAASAPQLPPGITRIPRSVIERRVLELAEAGQRLHYGDTMERVLTDLLFDWQGGRFSHPGFVQLMATTESARQFREALAAELTAADGQTAVNRLQARAADLAGRGEAWWITAWSAPQPAFTNVLATTAPMPYRDASGVWQVASQATNTVFRHVAASFVSPGVFRALVLDGAGSGQLVTWMHSGLPEGACLSWKPSDGFVLQVDLTCDGTAEFTLNGSVQPITENPPQILAAIQDTTVQVSRPFQSCFPQPDYRNYGNVLGVLYSKPMRQDDANKPRNYRFDNNVMGVGVQIQSGGRVALLSMREPFGVFIPRTLHVSGITDARGLALPSTSLPVQTSADIGSPVRGRVVRADATFAANVPVTLTFFDGLSTPLGCFPVTTRTAQTWTDETGQFNFDFVMGGVPYSLSATDVLGLSPLAATFVTDTVVGDAPSKEYILQSIQSSTNTVQLLTALGVTSVPEAIAVVEGVDRAVFRDLIAVGSPRVGAEINIALRFRGRGEVFGIVRDESGQPVANVAVNLYPDPGSRELGRGLFTGSDGAFLFQGVPLGSFSVEARDSIGRRSLAAGFIEEFGDVREVSITLLGNAPTPVSGLQGRVFNSDGFTPHPGARVIIGRSSGGEIRDVLAITETGPNGEWSVSNVPVGNRDVAAISNDNRLRSVRSGISVTEGAINNVNLTFPNTTVVRGRVEYANGLPVPGALVAGGSMLVRTDVNGLFETAGVPLGRRSLSAGLEADSENGRPFARIGSASADIVEGLDNFVVIRFESRAAISGRVFNTAGNPVPGIRVVIPQPAAGGFIYTNTDAQGQYRFDNLGLGSYKLSSPGPEVSTRTADNIKRLGQQALDAINEGATEQEISAAIGELFAAYAGVGDPLVEFDRPAFNPAAWGFTDASLTFDGQVAVRDIRHLPTGTVSGTVLNGQGVPVGARVRLTGIGPDAFGSPSIIIRGERDSDPATGQFVFPGQALAGSWGLQAANPFSPVVVTASGFTLPEAPDATGIILQFPPVTATNGRLVGTVLYPDGTAVSSNATVRINFGDLEILTRADGTFDTQFDIPARTYRIEATDPLTGWVGESWATVLAGRTNSATVLLQGRGGLDVLVLRGDGSPAANASVEIKGGRFPRDTAVGTTGLDGRISFSNLNEGPYAVCARLISGFSSTSGRSAVSVSRDAQGPVTVTLGGVGVIEGRFFATDGITPVPFGQIAIGSIGYTSTNSNGFYRVEDVPLGGYTITGLDPLNGRAARASGSLSFDGQTLVVNLYEQPLGQISGVLFNSTRDGVVPNAEVRLIVRDGISPDRYVTTGIDGSFLFSGVPPAAFTLRATHPVFSSMSASGQGTLSPGGSSTVHLYMPPLGRWNITVFEPDGITPADLAHVLVQGATARQADTDTDGSVQFQDMRNGFYAVTARSLEPFASRSMVRQTFSLTGFGEYPDAQLVLPGVGSVTGTVFMADGFTPAPGAVVDLRITSGLFSGENYPTIVSDATGGYFYPDVPLASVRIAARDGVLAGTTTDTLTIADEIQRIDVLLGASVSYTGRVVRADGVTPVVSREITAAYPPPPGYGLLGRALDLTDHLGGFFFETIPGGTVSFEMLVPEWNSAVVRFTTNETNNGSVVDIGTLVLDEDDPRVVGVTPSDTASGILTTSDIVLTFSEPISRHNEGGVYLQGPSGTIPSQLLLEDGPNGPNSVVRIIPNAPLISETQYKVFVLAGDRFGATGALLARGVIDRFAKPLAGTFISSFTTRDDDPPILVSFTPENGAEQVDPNAVVRLSFNEPILPDLSITVTNALGQAVSGQVTLGLNGLIAVFTPAQPLAINQTFGITVNNVRDLANNPLPGQPLTRTFHSLDTLGPSIADLRIKDAVIPLEGRAIELEAVLAESEPGVVVRMSANLSVFGQTQPDIFTLPYTLPLSGTVVFRAVAIDRFGNEGPLAELPVVVIINQPPTVNFAQVNPASGPAVTGSNFTFDLIGQDDFGVSSIQVAVANAATLASNSSAGTTRQITVPVSPTAGPGQTVDITTSAIDIFGKPGVPVLFQHPIVDGVPPVISTFEPTGAQTVLVNSSAPISISTSDAFGLASVDLILEGAINATNSFPFTVGMAAYIDSMNVEIPAGLQPRGETLRLKARVVDQSGFVTVSPTRTWNIFDSGAPSVYIFVPLTTEPLVAGEFVTFLLNVSDDVGVVETQLELTGAIDDTIVTTYATPTNGLVSVQVELPISPPSNRLNVTVRALDGLGQVNTFDAFLQVREYNVEGGRSTPSTRITSLTPDPVNPERVTLQYQTTTIPDGFSHVELYFRRNGIGNFNRYINELDGDYGFYPDENGTIVFDSTQMGGDGFYEFYTVGMDGIGNREPHPRNGMGVLTPDVTHTFSAGTVWKEITDFTFVGQGPEFENQNLRINGAHVVFIGPLQFQNVELINGALLQHGATTGTGGDPALPVEFSAWTLSVDATSRIDVSGLGYPGGFSKSNNVTNGRTLPGQTPGTLPSGGSHGGAGGSSESNAPGSSYGSPDEPVAAGAGGRAGFSNEPGGDGGGRIKLEVINLANAGLIAADGTSGQGGAAGSGAGGSIWIRAKSIAGLGSISAKGAMGEYAGGGGRIAIDAIDTHNLQEGVLSVHGGQALALGEWFLPFEANAAHGSMFIRRAEGPTPEMRSTLRFDGVTFLRKPTLFPFPTATAQIDDLQVLNGSHVEIPSHQNFNLPITRNVILAGGSVLTHSQGHRIAFDVDSMIIEDNTKIDVIGKGYRGGFNGGNFNVSGESLWGQLVTQPAQGGSHGGTGGAVDGYRENRVYGDPVYPYQPGAGGHAGSSNQPGGNGGGVFYLTADHLRLNGTILANGQSGFGGSAGSGAGGSVSLVVNRLEGSGSIEAKGGDGYSGGSGGRIAVRFDDLDPDADFGDDFRAFAAHGGRADFPGAAGTLVIGERSIWNNRLIVDDGFIPRSTIPTMLPSLGFVYIDSVGFDSLSYSTKFPSISGALAGQLLSLNGFPNGNAYISDSSDGSLQLFIDDILDEHPEDGLAALNLEGTEIALLHFFENVTVRGGSTLLIADYLSVNDRVLVTENSVITTHESLSGQPQFSFQNFASRLDISAAHIEVDSGSAIRADGSGWPGGFSEQHNQANGLNGSPSQVGGSYGGLGYPANAAANTFGSEIHPFQPGGGGGAGSSNQPGGDGGGLISLYAWETMRIDGEISANGLEGQGGNAGSGAGGSIWIETNVFTGNATISAHGGDGQRAGGGGRISFRYQNFTAWSSSIGAFGGEGSEGNGGAGSVYWLNRISDQDYLSFSNGGRLSEPDSTPFNPSIGTTFDTIDIFDANVLALAPIEVNDTFTIGENGVLSHMVVAPSGVNIKANNLYIEQGGKIDVSGRGYFGGRSGAQSGTPQGQTLPGLDGSALRVGGTHGGLGHSSFGSSNSWYGNVLEPTDFGSGGGAGSSNQPGGNGGGKVFLDVSFIRVDGEILANGLPGNGGEAGSGSGGSIHIISSSEILGDGFIQALGGDGQVPGGGGRIALWYNIDPSEELPFTMSNISARSGESSPAFRTGGAGTIVLKNANLSHASLRISNDNITAQGDSTLYPSLPTNFEEVIIERGAQVLAVSPIQANSLLIGDNTRLTHPPVYAQGLEINVGDLVIEQTGLIDVSGQGYAGARRLQQSGSSIGQTLDGLDGSPAQVGGSHAGLGHSTSGGSPNATYGSEQSPITFGSGGGQGSSAQPGGSGGGTVRIQASSFRLEGQITADGTQGLGGNAGSGAGGSIWISVYGTFEGFSGSLSASGGQGTTPGGGGRIAVFYNDLVIDPDRFAAFGGGLTAGNGTIFVEENPAAFSPPIGDTAARPSSHLLRITSMRINDDGTVTLTCEGDNGQPVTIHASPEPGGNYLPLDTANETPLRARPPSQPPVQFFRLIIEPTPAEPNHVP